MKRYHVLYVTDTLYADVIQALTDGGAVAVNDDLRITGDVCVTGDTVDDEGICLQTDYSNGDTGSRVFYREADSKLYGFSSIYTGHANPTFDGTAFTLTANKFYFLRHDNNETGAAVWSVARTSNDIAFTGTITSGAGRIKNTTRVTTTYTILVTDDQVFCNTDSGAYTTTLPVGVEGQSLRVINSGSSGNNLTVAPSGAETVYGSASFTLRDGESIDITYNATDGWY